MKWLAVDLGSTNTKGLMLDGIQIVAERTLPTPPNIASGARYELDPERYFRQVVSIVEELYDASCAGLLLSTQMHGYILTDSSFTPLTNYISWRDALSIPLMDEIRSIVSERAAEPSGVPLKPNLALCSLLARTLCGENLPDGGFFNTLGGYIIGRLTGEHVCHVTNAAPTGLAGLREGGWNQPLIEKAHLGQLRFPRIETGLHPVGSWRGLPIYPDLGDQQAGFCQSRPLSGGCLHVAFGTAGLLGTLTDAWGDEPYENRPWMEPGLYLRTVSGLPGGRRLAALHREILGRYPGRTSQEVWTAINTAPDLVSSSDADKPFYADVLAHSLLPAYEEFARQYAEAAQELGLPLREVVFVGGGTAKAPGLRKVIARGLGLRELTPPPDTIGLRAVAQILEDRICYGTEN